jgi:restriction endonuclease S subunit
VFGGVELLLPPLEEQVAISSFLDRETTRIDALIEKKQHLIEMTIPDKPNSRLQKYRLTDKGRHWLVQHGDG